MQAPSTWTQVVTIPPGATSTQKRIVFDGVNGVILTYRTGGSLAGAWAVANGTAADGTPYYRGLGAYISKTCIILADPDSEAFFQYMAPVGTTQGAMILAIASNNGTDPVTGHGYQAGQNGIDPVFGDGLLALGSKIVFSQVPYTQNALTESLSGSGASSPSFFLAAPEQGVSGHLVILMQGTSPDGTHPGQCLIATEPTGSGLPSPATKEMVEVQGTQSVYAVKLVNQSVAPTTGANGCALYTDSAGFPKLILTVDGNTYDADISSSVNFTTATTVNTVAPSLQTIVSSAWSVAAGSYEIEFDMAYNTLTATSGTPQILFNTAATITRNDANWQTYQNPSTNGAFHAQTNTTAVTTFGGPVMAAGQNWLMKGVTRLKFSTSGTISIVANTDTAGQFWQLNSIFAKLRPFMG